MPAAAAAYLPTPAMVMPAAACLHQHVMVMPAAYLPTPATSIHVDLATPFPTFGLLALFAMLGGMERQTFSFGSSSPYYYYYLPFQTVNLQDAGPARKGRANTVRSTGVQYVVQVCAPAARELEARTDITHPRGRSTHPNSGRRLVTRTQHETCPI